MSWFSVDTDALATLASQMAGTRDAVASAASLAQTTAHSDEAGVLAVALATFTDHWHYGLQRIVGNLDSCQAALHEAATAYQQVEHAIARAAGGGSPP